MLCALLAALSIVSSTPAYSADVLDRLHADGVLHCGAVERPGIADAPPQAGPRGVVVDICRAIAVAVLGPAARVSIDFYETPHSYDGLRRGDVEVGFLTGGEIAEQGLDRVVAPGPTVLITTIGIMVPETSPVRSLVDLTGVTVCLMIGSRAQRALESAAAARHLAISRLTFEEDVEMLDAYNVGNCGAAAGETTYLADMRGNPGVRRLTSRLLPELLAPDPIIAVTPRSDGPWAATVAWVIDALLLADAPADAWGAGRSPTLRPPDLRPDWRAEIAAAVGSYAAIIRRNLTEQLGLSPGPNALWPAGVLLPPAVR